MERRQRLQRLGERGDQGGVRLVVLSLCLSAATALAQDDRKSGYEYMSRQTQAMQDDEATGPAVLALLDGEALWKRDCARCHKQGMKGVATRYPALYRGKLVNLEERVNLCRVERQKGQPFPYESRELLALTAFIGRQSRGLPIEVSADPAAGRAFFLKRQGQLNLSCANCHDDNPGRKLGGSVIPQGHPTGYPIYRLEWQGMGSLQRRLRSCLAGMRAENYALGSPELVELELYLMSRARGMKLETPAVRP